MLSYTTNTGFLGAMGAISTSSVLRFKNKLPRNKRSMKRREALRMEIERWEVTIDFWAWVSF